MHIAAWRGTSDDPLTVATSSYPEEWEGGIKNVNNTRDTKDNKINIKDITNDTFKDFKKYIRTKHKSKNIKDNRYQRLSKTRRKISNLSNTRAKTSDTPKRL